jgi:DHA1 family tetracycline resistance protein-like MFS transporter
MAGGLGRWARESTRATRVSTKRGTHLRLSAQLVICLTVFVDLLGFTLVLPSLPLYAAELGASGAWVGVLLTSYSVMQFGSAPVLGRLSDRYGRRPVLLLALAGTTISLALTGAAQSLWLLLAARGLAGGFGGSIGVGQAFAVDLAGPAERTKALGRIGAAVGLAFVAGPALGAALAPLGFAASAYVAAMLAGANLAVAAFALPESRPAASRGAEAAFGDRGRRRSSGVVDRRPRSVDRGRPRGERDWPVVAILAGGFLTMFAFVGMEATFALLGQDRFGFGGREVGVVLAAAGLAMVVAQLALIGPLVARWGDRPVCAAGGLLMAGCLVAVPFLPAVACVAAVALLCAGYGLVSPTLASLLAQAGPAEQRGRRLGAGQSLAAAGRASGPVCAGALLDVWAALPYLVGATAAALASGGMLARRKIGRTSEVSATIMS